MLQKPRILNSVMLLCAGNGSRLLPETRNCPKPLIEVHGKPLVVWLLESLVCAGFQKIIINIAYLGKQIQEKLGNGEKWGISILYSIEQQRLGTAGGIINARKLLGEAPFLVVNSDIYCSVDFSIFFSLARRIQTENLWGWCLLVDNPPHKPAGDFDLKNSKLVSPGNGIDTTYTFSGIGLYDWMLFGEDPEKILTQATTSPDTLGSLGVFLHNAARKGYLGGNRLTGTWIDVGTPQRLAQARKK